ncbi:hypothetical protein [Chitinophaga sp. RAB17]|uniref:hypothetical protein n=1 Tax=Chitinophaga sp. RAB17 TaxID=3233049 RepID=UPI003F93220F
MLKQKNALKKISMATAVTAMAVGLVSSFSFESQAIATTAKKPGAIVVGIPPACDCTAPASTCYCIS